MHLRRFNMLTQFLLPPDKAIPGVRKRSLKEPPGKGERCEPIVEKTLHEPSSINCVNSVRRYRGLLRYHNSIVLPSPRPPLLLHTLAIMYASGSFDRILQ